MPAVFAALLRVHLACAAGATIAFWLAAFAPKGGPFHRKAGYAFSRLIYAAAVTGGLMALVELAAPTFVRPPDPSATADSIAAAVRLTRQTMWLVVYLLIIIVTPVHHGLATIAAAAQPMRLRSRVHAVWNLLSMIGSVLLVPAAVAWQQWTYLIVAPIGFIVGLRNLSYASRGFATPRDVQREHLTSLITAGIVLHTVMLVFTSSRTMGLALEGWRALAPWTVSALIGLPIILLLRSVLAGERAVSDRD